MTTSSDPGASAPISGPTVFGGDSSATKVVMKNVKNVKCVILQKDYFSSEAQFSTMLRGRFLVDGLCRG